MKNLYLLKTDKPSRLFKRAGGLFLEDTFSIDPKRNLHIYITSDEDIKEGDWVYENNLNQETKIYQIQKRGDRLMFFRFRSVPIWLDKDSHSCKKITLATDHSLEGVQQIDDEFLKWFVQNPKCEWVEVKKDYLAGYYIPQKQQTIEEAAKEFADEGRIACDYDEGIKKGKYQGFVAGAKWQQERDYELIDRYVDDVMGGCNLKFEDWVNR